MAVEVKEAERKLRIGFVHPDLGIGELDWPGYHVVVQPQLTELGGAERLVVDAAVALKERGHEVVIFTSRHDPKRCFEETRDGMYLGVKPVAPNLPSKALYRSTYWAPPCPVICIPASRSPSFSRYYDLSF